MISLIQNNKKCNLEFKQVVTERANMIIKKGYIIGSIKYFKNDFNRYTGAIIKYKDRTNQL